MRGAAAEDAFEGQVKAGGEIAGDEGSAAKDANRYAECESLFLGRVVHYTAFSLMLVWDGGSQARPKQERL